jgi:hypothetical protein
MGLVSHKRGRKVDVMIRSVVLANIIHKYANLINQSACCFSSIA